MVPCHRPARRLQVVVVDISRIIAREGSTSPPSRKTTPARPEPNVIQSGSSNTGSSGLASSTRTSHPFSSSSAFGSSFSSDHRSAASLPSLEQDSYGYPPFHTSIAASRLPDPGSGSQSHKRASLGPHPLEQPAKKQSKWSTEENRTIIQLRGENMKWEEISKRLPGRSAISCRLHYQNFLERKAEWTKDREAKLARLYER